MIAFFDTLFVEHAAITYGIYTAAGILSAYTQNGARGIVSVLLIMIRAMQNCGAH